VNSEQLRSIVDGVAWREQAEFELGERYPGHPDDAAIQAELRRVAAAVTPELLDALEDSYGYAVWALRLSPYADGDDWPVRARRHLDDPDPDTRYWARRLLDSAPG
jgi:gamma-glutamylcyclotransferase (GGCT)/AIG2-like uncharacterized protein YtfP